MRNRKRTGWHRYINGVTVIAMLVILFIALPLYWLISRASRGRQGMGASPPRSPHEPVDGELQRGLQPVRLRPLHPSTR